MARSGLQIIVKENRFAQISDEMRAGLADLVKRTAEEIARQAAASAPRDTGELAASIHAEQVGDEMEWAAVVPKAQFYGRFIEYGTVHQPARPFLTPAAETARSEFVAKAKRVLSG